MATCLYSELNKEIIDRLKPIYKGEENMNRNKTIVSIILLISMISILSIALVPTGEGASTLRPKLGIGYYAENGYGNIIFRIDNNIPGSVDADLNNISVTIKSVDPKSNPDRIIYQGPIRYPEYVNNILHAGQGSHTFTTWFNYERSMGIVVPIYEYVHLPPYVTCCYSPAIGDYTATFTYYGDGYTITYPPIRFTEKIQTHITADKRAGVYLYGCDIRNNCQHLGV
jgi:hypothetical protein